MKQYIDKVNRAGGICGRLLDLLVVNGRSPVDAAGEVFASLATPMHSATDQALHDGSITRAGLPVVGLDGFSLAHFSSPWAWPVGTSAASLSRIAVHHAFDAGARTFAVVYDSEATWGRESAAAFDEYVRQLGGTVKASVGLNPADNSYASKINEFNMQCRDESCDLILLALLPQTAKKWIQGGAARAAREYAGLPPLLNEPWAKDCARLANDGCRGFLVWSPFKPPVEPFSSEPAVAQYSLETDGDMSWLTESAALGARALVEALRTMGPNLTRARLAAALNDSVFDLGLSHPLDWAADNRHGNQRALAVEVELDGGEAGWKDAGTGWVTDPG